MEKDATVIGEIKRHAQDVLQIGQFFPSSSSDLAALTAACVVLPLLAASPAGATHLFGNVNGNLASAVHNNPNGKVILDPDPVVSLHVSSLRILSALATQGFDADGADNNLATVDDNWTITQGDLSENSLKVEFYRAFADTEPDATCGTITFNNNPTRHHSGGAAICLTYHAHQGDPTDIHWIQSILTNAPLNNKADDTTTFPGLTLHLDNFPGPNGNPYYDTAFDEAANATAFYDAAWRPLGNVDWEADVYVATGNLANRTLAIYDGARWGFEIAVPEPSSVALFSVSLISFAVIRLAAGARRRLTQDAS